jgi:hypothetical protein
LGGTEQNVGASVDIDVLNERDRIPEACAILGA